MQFFGTKDKLPIYAGIAAVSIMILTGLTLAATAVALTVVMPFLLILSPILVPAVITSSFLATGFLASGSLGASAIALLVWLYKKEERSKYSQPETTNKLPGGLKPPEEDKPLEVDKKAEENKLPRKDTPAEEGKQSEKDHKSLEIDKPLEEDKPPMKDNPAEEGKPSEKDHKSSDIDKPSEEDKPPIKDDPAEDGKPSEKDHKSSETDEQLGGVKHAEEAPSILEMSKLLLGEQNPIRPKCSSPSTSTKRSHQLRLAMDPSKVRSVFVKEYQKVPRVGALAYRYFTSRDKKIHELYSYVTYYMSLNISQIYFC